MTGPDNVDREIWANFVPDSGTDLAQIADVSDELSSDVAPRDLAFDELFAAQHSRMVRLAFLLTGRPARPRTPYRTPSPRCSSAGAPFARRRRSYERAW